jgi:hypothetical protein
MRRRRSVDPFEKSVHQPELLIPLARLDETPIPSLHAGRGHASLTKVVQQIVANLFDNAVNQRRHVGGDGTGRLFESAKFGFQVHRAAFKRGRDAPVAINGRRRFADIRALALGVTAGKDRISFRCLSAGKLSFGRAQIGAGSVQSVARFKERPAGFVASGVRVSEFMLMRGERRAGG